MADINPLTDSETPGFTSKSWDVFYIDDATNVALTTVNERRRLGNHRLVSFHLGDWDGSDNIEAPRGALCAAWQANTTSDKVAVVNNATSGWTFQSGSNDLDGWVHFICSGRYTPTAQAGTSDTITAKGSDGYIDPHRGLYLNHRDASPDTLASGRRIMGRERFRFQVIPFVLQSTDDTWKCATGTRGTDTLCPGIAAVAWQPAAGAAANRVAVTLDANGDVKFAGTSGTPTGWLWVWRAA